MTDMDAYQKFAALREELCTTIIGQEHLVSRLLIALLADGHLLVEGAPGLAKTRAIKELAARVDGDFHRIQFTPDLLPGDITGTDIYRPETSAFEFQAGPVFHNMVLADEINRAPAKVQSALLEAMAERQVSVGKRSYPLPELFLVMATQNPIEQEGTYPLPEAQLDRFLMHVEIDYPDADAERRVLRLVRDEERARLDGAGSDPVVPKSAPLDLAALRDARRASLALHLAEPVETYIVQLVAATRKPAAWGEDIAGWISWGASPRASLGLERTARAHAWLAGRDYVNPDDVQAVAHDVLRHRLVLGFEAEAEGVTTNRVIDELLARVPVA